MSAKQNVINQALQLSEADRLEVAEALYESMEGPAEPGAEAEWNIEVERRLRAIDSGQAKLIPWEQARRRIAGDAASND